MPQPMKIVVKDGQKWCPVPDAARYLKTRSPQVRKPMGQGTLAYAQIRKNGQLYVSVSDLVKVQTERVYGAKDAAQTQVLAADHSGLASSSSYVRLQ